MSLVKVQRLQFVSPTYSNMKEPKSERYISRLEITVVDSGLFTHVDTSTGSSKAWR